MISPASNPPFLIRSPASRPSTPMPPPHPAPAPSEAEADAWEEAFVRVESYLRAHRLERRARLTRLTDQLITQARRERRPLETPVAAGLRIADHHVGTWIERAVGSASEAQHPELARSRARLALEIADVPERWPEDFLGTEPIPPELCAAVRSAYFAAGPELRFSNMAPRPIDLGPVANLAGQTWDGVRNRPRLRRLLLTLALAAAALLAWQLLRP